MASGYTQSADSDSTKRHAWAPRRRDDEGRESGPSDRVPELSRCSIIADLLLFPFGEKWCGGFTKSQLSATDNRPCAATVQNSTQGFVVAFVKMTKL